MIARIECLKLSLVTAAMFDLYIKRIDPQIERKRGWRTVNEATAYNNNLKLFIFAGRRPPAGVLLRFSGLAKDDDSLRESLRRGCEPGLDIEAPEKPGRTARRSKSGPDLRRTRKAYFTVFKLRIRRCEPGPDLIRIWEANIDI
jgi:hypothetical protein